MEQNTSVELKQTKVQVSLEGTMNQPALIIGRVRRVLREAGYDQKWIYEVLNEAVSDDDEHFIDTLMAVVEFG